MGEYPLVRPLETLPLLSLCRENSISRLQINVNVVVDVLIPRGMEHIKKLMDIFKHAVLLKKLGYLPARQGFVYLIAFHAEYGELCFTAHFIPSIHTSG